jgi:inosine-uridine nucleoside N-ribohydrolase
LSLPRRVIIDTDPGIDDVVTLALAARSPEINLVAVTTTYGNATLALSTRNAGVVLRLAGRPDVPVLPGADRPLSRPLITAPEIHGPSGVGYAPVDPMVPSSPVPRRGVLLDILDAVPPPVTLVTIGPLTNLASALNWNPALVLDRVRDHIGMFGTIRQRGNVNRWADFNAWSDPEAADIVVRGELPTRMVGLDVTRQMTLAAAEVAALTESSSELARWLAKAMEFRGDACILNDVLPIAEIVTPGVLGFERMGIQVNLDESERRGHTKEGASGPIQVATSVDTTRIRQLLSRVFGRGWCQPHSQRDPHE